MAGDGTVKEWRDQLASLASALPFRVVPLHKFAPRGFTPTQVRQPRVHVRCSASTDPVTRFLVERGAVKVLPADQALDLFREIHWCAGRIRSLARQPYRRAAPARQAVDEVHRLMSQIEAAEEELYLANRRLVVACVKRYFWVGDIWLGDFLQEGSRALCNAVRNFDFTVGTPFFAYAKRAVHNRLQNHFRDHVRSGSLPLKLSDEMVHIRDLIEAWMADHTAPPSDRTLARLSGIPEARVHSARAFMSRIASNMNASVVSLDSIIGENNDSDLYEVVKDTRVADAAQQALKSEIWTVLNTLPERSRFIIRMRYLEGLTLEETGRRLNLTRARIKQIQDESLQRLRRILEPAGDTTTA